MTNPTNNGLSHAEIVDSIKKLMKELPDARADAARLDELRRLFSKTDLKFGQATPTNKAAAKWQLFLQKNHKRMVSQLCDRIQEGRRSSIRCLFGVIAASPLCENNNSRQMVNPDLLQKWFQSLSVLDDFDNGMERMIHSEFILPYRDIQYYAFGCLARLATLEHQRNLASYSTVGARLLELLMMIPSPSLENQGDDSGKYLFEPPSNEGDDDEEDEDSDDEDSASSSEDESNTRPRKRQKKTNNNPSFRQLKACRREFQKAWLAVLKLTLPRSSMNQALLYLPEHVLRHVPNALMFSDFFMEAYKDHGDGVAGVYALEGLFYLITSHELEYPKFYTQLYRLVSPRVLHAKYRGRFLTLLSNCLMRNELLPAHIVAAFCKKLCRSALSAPPSSGLFVLALVSNLLKKHSECKALVQRSSKEMEDGFVADATDPAEAQALQSSLWELVALEKHYLASMGTLAKSIGGPEESKLPMHQLEDFLDHTYESLFEMERKHKRNKKTPLTFVKPETVLTKNDVFSSFLKTT